jgi:hypothetical protein
MWNNSASAAILTQPTCCNTRYYKSILIRKYCIVKLECQLAFFFKPLKFWIEFRRAFSGRGGYVRLKFDCLNNFGTLENLTQLIIQLAVSKLYVHVRQICVVIFARSDRRRKTDRLNELPEITFR